MQLSGETRAVMQPAPLKRDRCLATTHQTGKPCDHEAGWGTVHPGWGSCKQHGGSTRNQVASCLRAMQMDAAERAVATLGLPVDVDPQTALLHLVQATAGHHAWLGQVVAAQDADALVQTVTGPGGATHERPSVWMELYGDYSDRLAKFSKMAVDAGVAERLVSQAEQLGEVLAEALRAIAADSELALTPAQMAALPQVTHRVLGQLAALTETTGEAA
jgi:hypothetical protein